MCSILARVTGGPPEWVVPCSGKSRPERATLFSRMPEPAVSLMDRAQLIASLDALSALLADTVESGAAVGFLPPLGEREAGEYWSGVADAIDREDRRVFAAWIGGVLTGSVQLQQAAMP